MSDPPFCEVEIKLKVDDDGRLVFTAMNRVEIGDLQFWSSIQSKTYTAYRTCIPYGVSKTTEVLLLQFEHTEPPPPKRYTKYVEYNGKWRRCHFESLAEHVKMRQWSSTKRKPNPDNEWGDDDSQVCTFNKAKSYLWISPPLSDRKHVPGLLQQLTSSSYTETRELDTFHFAQLACPFQPENAYQNINCDTDMLAGTDGLSKCFRLYGNPNTKSYAINRMVRPMDDADGFFLMHSPQKYDDGLYKVITALAGIGNEIPNNNDNGPEWTLVERLDGYDRPVSVGALQPPLTVCPVKMQDIWPKGETITCRAVLTNSSMLLKKHNNKWYLSGYDIIDQIHDHKDLRKQLGEEETYMPDRVFERQTIRFHHDGHKSYASKHEHHNSKSKQPFSIEEKKDNGIYTGTIRISTIPRSKEKLWKVNQKSIMRVQAREHRGMVTNHTFRNGKLEFTYTSQNSMTELDKVAPAPLNVAAPKKDWIGVFSLMDKAGGDMRYGRVKKNELHLSDSSWFLQTANLNELKKIESLYCLNIDHDLFYEVLKKQPQQKETILEGLYQSIAPHIACRTYIPCVQLVTKQFKKNKKAPVRIRLRTLNQKNLDSLRGGAVSEDDCWGVWLGENMDDLKQNEPNENHFGQWYSPKPIGKKDAVAYRSFTTTKSWENLQQWQRAWKHLVVADEIYRDILFTQTGDSGFAYKFIRRIKLHTVAHDYSSAIDVDGEFKDGTHELQRRPQYIRTSTAESKIQLLFSGNPVQRSVRRVQEGLYSVPQFIKMNQIKISNVILQFGNVPEACENETSFKISRRDFIRRLRDKLDKPQSRFNIIPHLRALSPLVGLRSINEDHVPRNNNITDYLKFLSDDNDAFDQLMHLLTGNIAYFMNRRTLEQELEQESKQSTWISCVTTPSPIVHLMQMRQNGKLNDPHFYPDIEDLFDSDALPLGSVDQIYLPGGNDDGKYKIPKAFKQHEQYLQWYFNQLDPPWEHDNKTITIPEELCQLAMCRARTRVLAFLKWKEMGGGLQGGSDNDEFIFHTDETYDDDIITTKLNKDTMWETFRLFGAMFPAILRLSMLPCARHAKLNLQDKRRASHGIHFTTPRYFEIPTTPNDRKTWNEWQQGDAPLPLNVHLSSKHVKAIARRCTNLEHQIVKHAKIYQMYFPVVMKSLLHQQQLTERPFGGIFQVQDGEPTCNYKWHILFDTTYNNRKRKKHRLHGKYDHRMLQNGFLDKELVVPHVMWVDPDLSIRRSLRKRVDTEDYVLELYNNDDYANLFNLKLSELLPNLGNSQTQISQFLQQQSKMTLNAFVDAYLGGENEEMVLRDADGNEKTFSATERKEIFGRILDALDLDEWEVISDDDDDAQ